MMVVPERAYGGVTVTDIILVIDHYGERTRSSLRSTAAPLHLRIWYIVCTCYIFGFSVVLCPYSRPVHQDCRSGAVTGVAAYSVCGE
ncbi:hypothetical protein ARMGADRAFT_441393 [Armillaria gallica]|uniref:Uncharacterized protein n=1 Tax=Armillaria gallica TaxID=47427 RepID=A0A2H3D9G8_ARMGA|nr:hypothetical protein ARMGADRAFT_441393 [Armillaria gallica]